MKFVYLFFIAFFATPASAVLVVEHTAGSLALSPNAYIGQSFQTPASPQPWTDITFSWLSTSGTEIASGNLFLLSQQYSGSPNGLSSSTPGFLGESSSIASGAYVFSSSVSLAPATTYFAYMGSVAPVSGGGAGINPGGYADGEYFQPTFDFTDPNDNYGPVGFANVDALFRVQGTAVPEPSGFVCLGLVGLVVGGLNWFKKRRRTA